MITAKKVFPAAIPLLFCISMAAISHGEISNGLSLRWQRADSQPESAAQGWLLTVANPGQQTVHANLYIIIEGNGSYRFWPAWTAEARPVPLHVQRHRAGFGGPCRPEAVAPVSFNDDIEIGVHGLLSGVGNGEQPALGGRFWLAVCPLPTERQTVTDFTVRYGRHRDAKEQRDRGRENLLRSDHHIHLALLRRTIEPRRREPPTTQTVLYQRWAPGATLTQAGDSPSRSRARVKELPANALCSGTLGESA